MSIRQVLEIPMEASDTTSAWYGLNSKIGGDNHPRSFTGLLVTGDTIKIRLSNDKDPNTTLETYVESDTYSTTTFGGAYIGGFRWVQIVKSGTAGAAKVKIEL